MNTILTSFHRTESAHLGKQRSAAMSGASDVETPTEVRDTARIGGSSPIAGPLIGTPPITGTGYQYVTGTSMGGASVSGMALLVGSNLGEKEEYVPDGAVSQLVGMDRVGVAVEEERAIRRLNRRLGEVFGVTEGIKTVAVDKSNFRTSDMGLHEAGEDAFALPVRARSVHLKTETHNFLMRESLESDKTTVAVWDIGKPMPDVWERDLEKNVLVGPGTKPVQPTPISQERVGHLA